MKYMTLILFVCSLAHADCVTEQEYDMATGQSRNVRRCGDHIKQEELVFEIKPFDPCENMTAFARQYAFPGTCKKRLEDYKQ